VLATKPQYTAAVERAGVRFWQKGFSIQNAIAKEPSLMKVFNGLAETDADFRIVTGETAKERAIIWKHYQEKGLKAFGNP